MTEPDPGTGRQQLKCGIFFLSGLFSLTAAQVIHSCLALDPEDVKTPFQFTVSQYIVALALAQVRIKTKANTFLSQILTQLPRSSLLPIHLSKSTRQHVKWSHRFSFAALKWLFRFSLAVVVEVFVGGGCRCFRWRWLSMFSLAVVVQPRFSLAAHTLD